MQNTATDAAAAAAASAVTVAGFATGLHYDVLLAGFAGALVSLSYTEKCGLWRRLWSLVTASLTAGYIAPVAAAYAPAAVTGGSGNISQGALIAAGFAVGLSAQIVIPGIINWTKRKLEQDA